MNMNILGGNIMNTKDIIEKLQTENQALKNKLNLCVTGTWETYSEEMYEELKDDKGRVWVLFLPEEDYYCAAYNSNGWHAYKTCTYYMPGRNPDKIARINPYQETK